MAKIEIKGDTAIIDEDDTFLGKLLAGTEGSITIKSPYIKGGKREIKSVKNKNGKELKQKKDKKEK